MSSTSKTLIIAIEPTQIDELPNIDTSASSELVKLLDDTLTLSHNCTADQLVAALEQCNRVIVC